MRANRLRILPPALLALTGSVLILCLGSSCAAWRAKRAKDNASNSPAAAGSTAGSPAPAKGSVNAMGPAAGTPTGRFITRASVENSDAPQTTPLSPGQDLINQALAGTAADTSRTSSTGGNGVPTASAERRVGIVRVIGARGKFVLIETTTGYGGVPLDEGQVLRSRGSAANGGEQTAVLKVARERQAPFLVADVVSGQPQAGDVAYFPMEKKK